MNSLCEVERLEDEIEEVEQELEAERNEGQDLTRELIEVRDLSEGAVEDMSLQAKREVAAATGLREETVNVRTPVAGRLNEEPNENDVVGINRSSPDTHTTDIEVHTAGEDDGPETMTVESTNEGPSLEAIRVRGEAA